MSDIRAFQGGIQGVGAILIIEQNEILALEKNFHFPNAAITVNLGFAEEVMEGINPLGRKVTMGSRITEEKPVIAVQFAHSRLEILEFLFGRKFEKTAKVKRFVEQFSIPLDGVKPAVVDPGVLGWNMGANQLDTKVSVMYDAMSYPLFRVPYSVAPIPSGSYQFMQGVSRELKFDPSLAGKTVTFSGSQAFDNLWDLGEEPLGAYTVLIQMPMRPDNKILSIEANNTSVALAGNMLDPQAASLPINFRVDQELGGCATMQVTYLDSKIAC